jgi:DNA-binding beta-propeller fold protein YncE
MVGIKRVVAAGGLAAVIVALVGCPSPFLARIKQEIAKAPFIGSTYVFARQFGNPHPEWSFNSPVVKTDTAGFVYVADSSFRIRKFSGAGVLQSTVSGISQQGTGARIYDMAFDTSGNMYVTTNDTNKVQKYNVSGNLLLQWGSSTDLYGAGTVAIGSARGIAVDSSGFVYVVDSTFGHYRVLKFNSSGAYQTEWGNATTYGTTPTAALSSPQGIVEYGGNVYVLDSGNHRVVELNSANGAYVYDWGADVTDLYPPTTGMALSSPSGIAIGTTGFSTYVYVADTSNNRIVRFSTGGTYNADWGSSSTFSTPDGVAIDTSGYVYVTDGSGSFQDRIQKFDVTSTPALNATWGGSLGTGDGLTVAPWGVAFDSNGSIVLSELLNSRLERFDAAGAFVAKYPLPGSFTTGVAIDAAGQIYATDFTTSRYKILDSSGNTVTSVGGAGAGDGQLSSPIGAALDSSGNVYIADSGNTRVQVFSSSGYYARKWGSAGTADGQFTAGSNYGIAVDPTGGFVYVSDYRANRIQKFDLNGNFLLKWGTFGNGDGQLNAPIGIAVDPIGNVYICDMMNHRVQKFDSNGNFITKFGTAGAGNGGFGWPVGIAVNAAGTVVVTDYTGALVQEFTPQF